MNFFPSEPNTSSVSGMGTIRTMQGDLKNIRASKSKVQPQPELRPQLEPLKQKENDSIFKPLSVFKEPVVASKEPILEKNEEQDQEQKIFNLEKEADKSHLLIEKKIEKVKKETVSAEIPVKKEEKKIQKPIIETSNKIIKNKISDEGLIRISDDDKTKERIRMVQEKIRPLTVHKEVAAPENILSVSEMENKAATQYAASLSQSAQNTDIEKEISEPRVDEENEYLPPELRLYRNTRSSLGNFKKESASLSGINKSAPGINQNNGNVSKKIDFSGIEKKTGRTLKIAGVLVLIVAIGAYFIFIKKTDLSFLLQWLPKNPVVTPVLTPSPTAVSEKINIKNIINIKDAENFNFELLSLKNKENPPVSIVSFSLNDAPVIGQELLNRLNIVIPNNIKNYINADNLFLIYFATNNRLGLAFEAKDKEQLLKEMKVWENARAGDEINPMPYTLSLLLLGNFFELNQDIVFKSGNYKEETIRFANLPDSYRSIDYSIIKNFLVITTSKDNMSLVIDELNK